MEKYRERDLKNLQFHALSAVYAGGSFMMAQKPPFASL
jgi:hypothetical protein